MGALATTFGTEKSSLNSNFPLFITYTDIDMFEEEEGEKKSMPGKMYK